MADIFYPRDARKLLQGKKIYLIGDSNIRALYKDIVCLLVHNHLLTEKQLREKAERHFLGDDLLRGSPLTKGRAYREERRYNGHGVHVEFTFVTKCLNEDIEAMMEDIRTGKTTAPDIIVMNSTLWDVNRWGYNGVDLFKENMNNLLELFKLSLPSSTLVIWVTTPPLAVEIRGGFMIKQIEFAKYTMRFHVMEANLFAQQLFRKYGFNVLDFHYHLRWQVHWRNQDGLHWSNKTMRHLGNLLLTHIALSLRVPLPGNHSSALLEKHKEIMRSPPTTSASASTSSASSSASSATTAMLPPPPPSALAAPRPRPVPLQAKRQLPEKGQGQGQGWGRGRSKPRGNQNQQYNGGLFTRRRQNQAPEPWSSSSRWNAPSRSSDNGTDYHTDGPFEFSAQHPQRAAQSRSQPQQIQSWWGTGRAYRERNQKITRYDRDYKRNRPY